MIFAGELVIELDITSPYDQNDPMNMSLYHYDITVKCHRFPTACFMILR